MAESTLLVLDRATLEDIIFILVNYRCHLTTSTHLTISHRMNRKEEITNIIANLRNWRDNTQHIEHDEEAMMVIDFTATIINPEDVNSFSDLDVVMQEAEKSITNIKTIVYK